MTPRPPAQAQELEASARDAKIKIITADANQPDELDNALRKLSDERVDVVIVLQTSMLLAFSRQIAASALKKRLSTDYGYREHVLVGGWARRGFETSRILRLVPVSVAFRTPNALGRPGGIAWIVWMGNAQQNR
jgi:hypothetical protein